MTDDLNRKECLELYKLHAELADRVSQRREGANRLYAGFLLGLAAILGTLLRFGSGDLSLQTVLLSVGILGSALSASWYLVIRSYRQLNRGKFLALDELESKLVYPFFRREWELLGKGKNRQSYLGITIVETGLPIIFFLLSLLLIIIAVCML